jgi:hypothetical protein
VESQGARLRLKGARNEVKDTTIARRINEDDHPGDVRNGVLEQLQAFARQFEVSCVQPREVPARLRQALHEPLFDQIDRHPDHNRDRRGRLLERLCR